MRRNSRPARESDVRALFDGRVPVSMKARVLEIDGELAGIIGYYVTNGTAVVFSEIRKTIPKMTIVREAMAFLDDMKVPAVCVAENGSGPLLERLGWVTEDGEVYQWLH